MKPIIFPFTFLSETLCEKFGLLFPQFVLYHPSAGGIPERYRKWSEEGRVELRAPLGGQEERLESLVDEYREWLVLHRGSETTFFKTRLFDSLGEDTVPMFSETSTSQIKADIKRGGVAEKKPKIDSMFTIRLFLLIAHAFDAQHYELNRDLEQFRDLEKDLFTVMRGEDDSCEESEKNIDKVIADDVGSHKTGQRISAWLKLFEQEPVEPDEFGSWLLLTTSEAVLDQIPDYHSNIVPANVVSPLPLEKSSPEKNSEFKNFLADQLERLSKELSIDEEQGSPFQPSTEDLGCARLKIYAFPGKSPRTLFLEEQAATETSGDNLENIPKTFVAKFEYI